MQRHQADAALHQRLEALAPWPASSSGCLSSPSKYHTTRRRAVERGRIGRPAVGIRFDHQARRRLGVRRRSRNDCSSAHAVADRRGGRTLARRRRRSARSSSSAPAAGTPASMPAASTATTATRTRQRPPASSRRHPPRNGSRRGRNGPCTAPSAGICRAGRGGRPAGNTSARSAAGRSCRRAGCRRGCARRGIRRSTARRCRPGPSRRTGWRRADAHRHRRPAAKAAAAIRARAPRRRPTSLPHGYRRPSVPCAAYCHSHSCGRRLPAHCA